jgi:hypothetical protein
LERRRVKLRDGAGTTLHIASFERSSYTPKLAIFSEPEPLARWCRSGDVRDALVGGFFWRASGQALGEHWLDGSPVPSVPFDEPWGARRACLELNGERVRIAWRDELGAVPSGDLLQAGPLLVSGGGNVIHESGDIEGFSAGARQFDSDITDGRYPRAALGVSESRLLAVVCDGRTSRDAGMTLAELGDALVALGAESALNLDGGGSASLVYDRRLRNRPREQHGIDLLDGRPVVSALVFRPLT